MHPYIYMGYKLIIFILLEQINTIFLFFLGALLWSEATINILKNTSNRQVIGLRWSDQYFSRCNLYFVLTYLSGQGIINLYFWHTFLLF